MKGSRETGFKQNDLAETTKFELWPHRSLDGKGIAAVVALGAVCAAIAVLKHRSAGVLPMLVGAGLTAGVLAVAFWRNNAAAAQREVIEVDRRNVVVTRYSPGQAPVVTILKTYWARVELVEDRRSATHVTLSERGQTITVGAFLSPTECAELAESLAASIARYRTSPVEN